MGEYSVYIRINSEKCITAVNSSGFLYFIAGWVKIDSGVGDKYYHAQGNYFDKPITDDRGIFRYITFPVDEHPSREAIHTYPINGTMYGIYERTQEEMDADWVEPEHIPSQEERISYIERAVYSLLGGVIDSQA